MSHGTLNVPTGGATISNNDSNSVTLSGTAAQINAALASLQYTNIGDYNGPDSLSIITSDGSLTDTDTIAITVTPVVDIADDTATTTVNTPIIIDVIANDSFENATPSITAINGTLVNNGDTVAVPNGTVTLNAADGPLTFNPAPGYTGNANFTYTVTSGGTTETANVTVTVNPDTPPVNTIPGPQTAVEDTPQLISGISVADSTSVNLTTTLTIGNGTLHVPTGGGVVIINNNTNTLTLSGTAANINATLAGLEYTNIPDYNGSDTLTVSTTDGTFTDTDSISITVTPVVDIADDNVTAFEDNTLILTLMRMIALKTSFIPLQQLMVQQ